MTLYNAKPLVSVVVPGYNHERFIKAALESVFDQTYSNIELIVIDDCSSDETVSQAAEVLARNIGKLTSVHFLRNVVNLGADATINKGIKAATGNFVTILNSDDLFLPERIQRLVDAMLAAGGALAFSKVAAINDAGKILLPSALPRVLQGALEQADICVMNDPSLGFGFLRGNLAISTGNLLFSRSLYDRLGGFRSLKYVHDWDFVLRALPLTEPVYVAEELYLYRIHGSNSFSQLAGLAEVETAVVFSTYQELMRLGPVLNKLAPSPQNWPHLN